MKIMPCKLKCEYFKYQKVSRFMKRFINKRNIFFIFVIAACVLIFVKRYSFLPDYIVSNPDTYIEFNVQDEVIEQTWQPRSKMISGVSMPYRVLDGFTGDLELIIYNDDRSKEIVSRKGIEKTFETGEEGNVDFEFSKTKSFIRSLFSRSRASNFPANPHQKAR